MTDHTTPFYTVAVSAYVKAEAARRMYGLWWFLPVPIALLIAGLYDARFFYLCLMLVLIVRPMFISFTWLLLATRPEMQWAMRPQQCVKDDDGSLTVSFHEYPEPDTAPDVFSPVVGSVTISPEQIAEATREGAFLKIVNKSTDSVVTLPFLLIPADRLSAPCFQ